MLVAKWCLTLCDSTYRSPPDSSVHGDSSGEKTGVASLSIFQGSSNPGLPHCRRVLSCLSHQESPFLKVNMTQCGNSYWWILDFYAVLTTRSFSACRENLSPPGRPPTKTDTFKIHLVRLLWKWTTFLQTTQPINALLPLLQV